MKRFLSIAFLLPALLFSQDYEDSSLDDLFSDPVEDVVTTIEPTVAIIDVVEETELVTISGFFGGTAGVGIGLLDPTKGVEDSNVEAIVGAAADSNVTFNIRPDKSVNIEGTFEASIDDTNIQSPWNDIQLSNFFVEYNMLDTAIISFGKMDTTVASDFVSISDGTSILIKLPTVLSGLNFFANADESTLVHSDPDDEKSPKVFDYKQLYVATWLDAVVGSTRLSAGMNYKKEEDLLFNERFGFLLAAQTNLFNVNMFSELQYFTVEDHNFIGNVGAYYVNGNLFTGAQYDFETYAGKKDSLIHSVEVGMRYTSIFDSMINVNIATKLQIDTMSGFVIPALTLNPFKYVTVSLAMPYMFGDKGFDAYKDFLDDEYAIQIPTELSLLASVSVDIPF